MTSDPNSTVDPHSTVDLPVRPPKRRTWVWIVVVVLLAAGGVGGYRLLAADDGAATRYRTAPVTRGDLEQVVTATGTVSPRVTVTVGSQVTGRVLEIFVDFNSKVRKGQVIARIDAQLFKTEVLNARANLAAARANLKKAQASAREAKLQYERDRGLSAQKVVAPAEVETRHATYQSAEAQVVAARASVEQAKASQTKARTNLAYTTIVSPIDGVIVSRSVDVGQTVAASLQAPTLFTIAEDLRKMEVHTSVAESDVGQVTEGMQTRFTVDAFADESFSGEVKQVRYEAQTVQNVVTYDAVISVKNDKLKLRPGMTANVTFVRARRKGVLKVPTTALRFRPPPEALSPGMSSDPGQTGPSGKVDGRGKIGGRGKVGGREKVGGRGKRGAAGRRRSAGKRRGPKKRDRQVWILRGGVPTPLTIVTGISDGSHSELLRGELAEGDEVIVGVEEERKKRGKSDRKRPRRRRLF